MYSVLETLNYGLLELSLLAVLIVLAMSLAEENSDQITAQGGCHPLAWRDAFHTVIR